MTVIRLHRYAWFCRMRFDGIDTMFFGLTAIEAVNSALEYKRRKTLH